MGSSRLEMFLSIFLSVLEEAKQTVCPVGGEVGFLHRVDGDPMVFWLGDVFFDCPQCGWGFL